MEKNSKIVVFEPNMISSAICKMLKKEGYSKVYMPGSDEVNLEDEESVFSYYDSMKPEYVFCFAGPHGGISENMKRPAEFIYKNLKIQNNIIHGAYLSGVKRLLFITGACAYPKECPQPMKEEYFMDGKMEPTSVAYSMAKASGIEMCLAYNRQYSTEFIPCIICNNYGPGDDFSEAGHVLSAMIRKLHAAKTDNIPYVEFYGSGLPKREFMYSEDIARAAICIMGRLEKPGLVNIGGGEEVTVKELAFMVKKCIGYDGEIRFDTSKPDGAMRKLCDGSRLKNLGFRPAVSFGEGLERTYGYYLENEVINWNN